MPEEAPQEIADLVSRCTSDVEERPDAHECVEIIQPFVRAGSLRVSSSQPLTPGTVNTPRRFGGGQPLTPGAGGAPLRTGSGGSGVDRRTKSGVGESARGQPLTPGASGGPQRTGSGGSSGDGRTSSGGGELALGNR